MRVSGPGFADAMIVGGLVAVFSAVDAEGKSLEDIATPVLVIATPVSVIATPVSVIATPAEALFRAGGAPGPLPSARD
jgi:hypothetical protein